MAGNAAALEPTILISTRLIACGIIHHPIAGDIYSTSSFKVEIILEKSP